MSREWPQMKERKRERADVSKVGSRRVCVLCTRVYSIVCQSVRWQAASTPTNGIGWWEKFVALYVFIFHNGVVFRLRLSFHSNIISKRQRYRQFLHFSPMNRSAPSFYMFVFLFCRILQRDSHKNLWYQLVCERRTAHPHSFHIHEFIWKSQTTRVEIWRMMIKYMVRVLKNKETNLCDMECDGM